MAWDEVWCTGWVPVSALRNCKDMKQNIKSQLQQCCVEMHVCTQVRTQSLDREQTVVNSPGDEEEGPQSYGGV